MGTRIMNYKAHDPQQRRHSPSGYALRVMGFIVRIALPTMQYLLHTTCLDQSDFSICYNYDLNTHTLWNHRVGQATNSMDHRVRLKIND
jgi:hypothetical protein